MRGKIAIFMIFILVLASMLAFTVSAQEVKTFVTDNANIIEPTYRTEISAALEQIFYSGKAEFAVYTVNSLEGKPIEQYAIDLAQGVLGDKEKDNGLLLLVALDDREYRFEVGSGLEGELNDAKVGRIGRYYLVDNFRAGEYGKGIYEATSAVKSVLLGENETVYYSDVNYGREESNFSNVCRYIQWFIIFIFIISTFSGGAYKKGKKKKGDKYFAAATMAALMFGGRGGGGLGGGGFGGFGGGGFSGGGSSGGW